MASTWKVLVFTIFISQICLHQLVSSEMERNKFLDLTMVIDSTVPSGEWNLYLDFFREVAKSLDYASNQAQVALLPIFIQATFTLLMNNAEARHEYGVLSHIPKISRSDNETLNIKNGLQLALGTHAQFGGRDYVQHVVLLVVNRRGADTKDQVESAATALKNSGAKVVVVGLSSRVDEPHLRNLATSTNSYRHYLTSALLKAAGRPIADLIYSLVPTGTFKPPETTIPTTKMYSQTTFFPLTTISTAGTGPVTSTTTPKTTTTNKPSTAKPTPMPQTCLNKPCIQGTICPTTGDDDHIRLCAVADDVCARYCYSATSKPVLGSDPAKSNYPQCKLATAIRSQLPVTLEGSKLINVDVTQICPSFGPVNGDTVLHLWGSGLNVKEINIKLVYSSYSVDCAVIYSTSTALQCRTPSVVHLKNVLMNRALELRVYSRAQLLHKEPTMFIFKENPTVSSVSPKALPISGSRDLTITGTGFDGVPEAIYEVRASYKPKHSKLQLETVYLFASLCNIINSTIMVCPSPKMTLPSYVTNPNDVGPTQASYGKNENGNYSVYHRVSTMLSGRKRRAVDDGQLSSDELTLYPRLVVGGMIIMDEKLENTKLYKSPQIKGFSDDSVYKFYNQWPHNEKHIKIPGQYLNSAAGISDYNVQIGGKPCPVEEVSSDNIKCRAPETSPPTNSDSAYPLLVITYFGQSVSPGYVKYMGIWDSNVFKYSLIAAILIFVLLILIIIFACIFCSYRKKSTKKAGSNHYSDADNRYKPNDYNMAITSDKPAQKEGSKFRRIRGKTPSSKEENGVPTPTPSEQAVTVVAAPLVSAAPVAPRPPSIVSDHSVVSSNRDSVISNKSPLLDELDDQERVKVMSAMVTPEQVEKYEEINRGNRGIIYAGRLTRADKTEIPVIIKTFREKDVPLTDRARFIREAVTLREFNNRSLHVTEALVIQDEVPFSISPMMENGDLKQYLHKVRATQRNEFSLKQQIGFARDIAKGMAFLSERTFVHKDLAARNCVVDKALNAKVSDTALSRDIYDIDYYYVDKLRTSLPFKWMALEGVERFIFSTKTDIWSFGVLLWEIMTLGGTPYTDVDNADLKRYLKRGNRLRQPNNTPDTVYEMMQACWQTNPDKRPRFLALVDSLDEMLSEDEEITIMGSMGETGQTAEEAKQDVFMM